MDVSICLKKRLDLLLTLRNWENSSCFYPFSAGSKLKGIFIIAEESDDEDTPKLLAELIEGMTGIEPLMEYTLEQCGLASIGVPILVNLLNKNFSTKQRRLNITASDLVGAKTIGDMVEVVDAAKALADDQGV